MPPIQPIPCATCGGGGAGGHHDVEPVVLCDINPATGEIVGAAIAVYDYDNTTGLPSGPPTFVIPGTNTPYVPQFTLQPCDSEGQSDIVELCDIQPDGSAVQFVRHYIIGPTGVVVSLHDSTLAGVLYTPTGTVQDCDPFALCTPDSNLDLNANCGPGETAKQTVVAAAPGAPLANSVFVDDATADPLCGGTWNRGPSALPPGFPVAESFRNTTFDQPGPVTGGSPAPFLTAGPPVNDGAGAGWFREADTSGGSNGFWQVPTPFSTSQGINAAITWASHDGTIPGGDGQYFVFTDGSAAVQATPIGGFGNLGLNNWDAGVFAIVLDEYGQSCTCDHTPHGTISPNPGPCGFCSNSISIQLAGTARAAASCACCTIASMPLAPKALNQTTRAQPVRLLTSVITEAGQTYVSASLDWNDGNGPIQYFNRVNITACVTVPATLRMAAFSGSGGAFQAIKEIRDAVARPAGVSNWRAFPITTDPIVCPGPGTPSLVNVSASVDVTPNDDGTQTAGNGNPELYFWLVNTATNTILDSSQYSILPSNIGTLKTLSVSASVAPADVPNLRLYVGDESRDEAGEYDVTWENLKVDASAAGCPATPRRTMEISARCPIPVAIVSGGSSGDSGGGGTTVVNTPSTFEDALVCATIGGVAQPAFRREIHLPDGTVDVTFIGQNGLPVTPSAWTAGECPETPCGEVIGQGCYEQSPGLILYYSSVRDCTTGATVRYDQSTGVDVTALPTATCTFVTYYSEMLCDANGREFVRKWPTTAAGIVSDPGVFFDNDLDGNPISPVAPVGPCGSAAVVLGEICYSTPANGPNFRGGTGSAGSSSVVANPLSVTYLNYLGSGVDVVVSSPGAGGFAGTDKIQFNPNGIQNVTITFSQPVKLNATTHGELDGPNNNEFVGGFDHPVTGTTSFIVPGGGPGEYSSTVLNGNPDGDIQFGGVVTNSLNFHVRSTGLGQWLQGLDFNTIVPGAIGHAAVVKCDGCADATPQYFDIATGAELIGPTIVDCPSGVTSNGLDVEVEQLCDANSVRFLRRYVYNADTGVFASVTDTTLDGSTAYVPVAPVGGCTIAATVEFDQELLVLCDSAVVPNKFLRRYSYNETTQALVITNTTLDGSTAFVPTGAVQVCPVTTTTDLDFVELVLCDSNGTQFIQRLTFNSTTGAVTATTNTTLTGGAFAPVGAVSLCSTCCPVVLEDDLCTNTGSGRGVSIRNVNGTISLLDAVTGAAITAANIVACAPANGALPATLASDHFDAVPGTPWTPAAIPAGRRLTSLTYTVLAGTATVVDATGGTSVATIPAGYTATWSVSDDRETLTPPVSITAAVGARVLVLMTTAL